MKNQIMQNLKAIVLGLIIAVGASYALAWTPPASEPTGGNVAAPINVGGGITGNIYTQTKSGILNLAHLFTSDLNVLNSDGTIPTVSASSVLVADTTTPGKVKWGTMSGGSSSLGVKSWVDTGALAAGKTFTINHTFSSMPIMYKASIVKVSASTLDGYSVGDEIGSESFQQWPNSYNAPFAIYANSTSITVRVDKNVQGFIQSGDGAKWDGSEIWTADMPNWRLKIVAIGNN